MARRQPAAIAQRQLARASLAPLLLMGLVLSGCASTAEETPTASIAAAPAGAGAARDYWASAVMKNPRDEKAAIAYARALKAEGSKDKAFGLLQQAAMHNPDSRDLASEMGRLALEIGQPDLAEKLLLRANDPAKPDWRVLNALGTLRAQQEKKEDARSYFERAVALAPNEPSVLNNLALTYALDGDAAKAETMLRRAAASGGDVSKVRQNLALVLGVQGKVEEASSLASAGLDKDQAAANKAFLQKFAADTPVKLGKPLKVPAASWSADVAPMVGTPMASKGPLPWTPKISVE